MVHKGNESAIDDHVTGKSSTFLSMKTHLLSSLLFGVSMMAVK